MTAFSEASRSPGFMPPHVLERIVSHGNTRLQQCARTTLQADAQFRLRSAVPAAARPADSHRPGEPARYIYDANQQQLLPGDLVRREDEPETGDTAVDEAYQWLGATHRFYWQVFRRDSIDGEGMALLGTVHYGEAYDNAFWNGAQMVFGDGDGELFERFTAALDVVAHELTHGVIERDAGLIYADQSGALNESLADVFGTLVKQHHFEQRVDEADWLIGEGLLTARVNGRALRSMAEPGTAYDDPVLGRDPQPGHMDDFARTSSDNGGVHINSGIPNRAFYLAATRLEGYAWEQAGVVWYDALTDDSLQRDTDFAAFARLTIAHAGERYGRGGEVERAVASAWRDVGVTA
ncbi:M4 family metallopeptidase [Salinicola avicenniae]|uniref:M4 family metallopeptidase n=1 Tax=Salinicola avicenniae TaxID=2916836 RepID=UPI002073F7EF|nr:MULTISPECIES: M4 family metallopeptidase [unclassified Salinicola]